MSFCGTANCRLRRHLSISCIHIEIPTSLILVFLLFMARTAPRVAQFQQQFNGFHLAGPAVRVVNQMISESQVAREHIDLDGKNFDRLKSAVKLEDVEFKFPESDVPAVDRVSMKIPHNKMIAIVGGSGAGIP